MIASPGTEQSSAHLHQHGPDGQVCGCSHTHPTPHDRDALFSARALWFTRGGRALVAGVDLDVRRGEIVTLIGPNGAGKTTLVKLILGIERPDTGSIRRNAETVIGYVPQRFEIGRAMPMTVAGFMTIGQRVTPAAALSALREAGAERTANQQLADLSGGETQRVLIARALLRDPNLLVLDEPARGVDYVGEAELYAMIERLKQARNLGVLLVSHDLRVVMAQSDRVICLNGHVCCSGQPEAVAKHPEYARLFGRDMAGALAIYTHHHDHRHDVATEAGITTPGSTAPPGSR